MKYVLDSCVALKWVLPESDSDKATALRDRFLEHVHELIAPDIFTVEVAHALAKAERRGTFKPPEGTRRLLRVLSTPPNLYPHRPLLRRAFEIASQARIGVYDCLYIALAEQERCELMTADARLIRSVQKEFPFIVQLASRANL
jgi:predicted nucleic acid-binding protein